MDANATGEDALKDDDGDVVMIDIDDPAEINQIAEDLHTSRALTQTKRPSQWTDVRQIKVISNPSACGKRYTPRSIQSCWLILTSSYLICQLSAS